MSNEIASITVLVPHHIGTETINQVIPFRVYRQEQNYVAVPFISAAERLTSGLPESLSFALVNNRLWNGRLRQKSWPKNWIRMWPIS